MTVISVAMGSLPSCRIVILKYCVTKGHEICLGSKTNSKIFLLDNLLHCVTYFLFSDKISLLLIMPLATPKAIFRYAGLSCPYPGCGWSSKAATKKCRQNAYTRHYSKHKLTYRFLCPDCGARENRKDSFNKHLLSCLGSKEANEKRRGRKPAFRTLHQQPGEPDEEEEDPAETIQILREEMAAKDETIKNLESRLQDAEFQLHELEATSEESDEGTDQHPTSPSLQSDLPSSPSVANEVQGGVDLDLQHFAASEVHHMQPPACAPSISQQEGLRRSTRQPSSSKLQAEQEELCRRLRSDVDSGLIVAQIPRKGRGVVTSKFFPQNSFVVEYAGKLVDYQTSFKLHNEVYGEQDGSYIFWFKAKGTWWAIDATEETPRLGRLINHSHRQFNLIPKVFILEGQPRIYLVARRDINPGEELTFNYGETDKRSVHSFPWLKQ